MTEKAPHPRVSEFLDACKTAELDPDLVIREAGIHRSVWHRWRTGAFAPNFKNWDTVERTFDRLRQMPAQDAAA